MSSVRTAAGETVCRTGARSVNERESAGIRTANAAAGLRKDATSTSSRTALSEESERSAAAGA